MKRKFVKAALLILVCLLLPGCRAESGKTAAEETFWQMDCAITVRLYGEKDAVQSALTEAGRILAEKDALLSATLSDSPVARLNAGAAGEIPLPAEVTELLYRALEIEKQTDGAFTVTVEPLLACWRQAETAGKMDETALAAALLSVGGSHLTLTAEGVCKDADTVAVNLGGIGKGYALDAVTRELSSREGLTGGILSCTSNVTVFGTKSDGSGFSVALRNPVDRGETLPFTLQLTRDAALSVSGDYERYFTVDGQTFSHILDPVTGYPPENGLRSVAVLAENATLADALSTALMVMGEERGRELRESGEIAFEALFVYEDGYSATEGFAARMTEKPEE